VSAHGNATLDGVTLMVTSSSGMAYANVGVITPLLDDGTFAGGNAVMQTAALPFRQETIGFATADIADVVALDADRDAKDTVSWTDPDGTVYSVVVFEFTRSRSGNSLWECTAVLVEAPAGGS
jgi:hypothetical protein